MNTVQLSILKKTNQIYVINKIQDPSSQGLCPELAPWNPGRKLDAGECICNPSTYTVRRVVERQELAGNSQPVSLEDTE